jgi:hypothetical protein
MARGNPKNAESYLSAMEALKEPFPRPWNLKQMFYTWQAPLLRGMALRMQGMIAAADAVETNAFIRAGAKISLIHATRGRPDQAAACRRKWLDFARNPDAVEHIFGLDADDETANFLAVCRHVQVSGKNGPVEAWNVAATATTGKIIIQLSDDWIAPHGWDRMILEAIGDRIDSPAVLAINDGHRTDNLLCMAIMTRERWKQQQGAMFHPAFFSMHSDDWFSHCAFRDGIVIDARDRITFEHDHPAFTGGEWDETYKRSNAPERYAMGKAVLDKLLEMEAANA